MSVLRMRLSWVIPTAGMLVGALTLGLAGCGSGGEGFPTGGGVVPVTPVVITVPASARLGPQTATNPQTVVPGSATTINSPAMPDPNVTNGVATLTATIPAGAISAQSSFAVQLVPTGEQTLVRLQQLTNLPSDQQLALSNFTPIAEIVFGQVDPNNQQIKSVSLAQPVQIKVGLSPAAAAALDTALNSGQDLVLTTVDPTTGRLIETVIPRSRIVRDPATGQTVITLSGPGDLATRRPFNQGQCQSYFAQHGTIPSASCLDFCTNQPNLPFCRAHQQGGAIP